MSEYAPLDTILNGDIIGGIVSVYTSEIGVVFYGFMILIFCTLAYLKTENPVAPAIVGIVVSVAFSQMGILPEQFVAVMYIVIALSISVIVYKVMKSEG